MNGVEGLIQPGERREAFFQTRPVDGTDHAGPTAMLSTPSLVRYMEFACHQQIQARLSPPEVSVGSAVNIRHLGPCPIGNVIRVVATLLHSEKRRYTWQVEVWWGERKIGDGTHERAVVDTSRYQAKATGTT